MARERKPVDHSPLLPPVKRINLDGGSTKKRVILIIAFVLVALLAFGYAITQFLKGTEGWQTVSVDSGGMNASSEVTLQYNYTGLSTAGRKKLSLVYAEASENAYALFNESQHVEGKSSLYDISASVGKKVKVDETLYKALETVEKYNSRLLYLAPIYSTYSDLFFCEDDSQAKQFDPSQDSETADYFARILSFVSKEENISMELLGDNTVKLNVSNEYLAFAKENKIDYFLDFYWLKNAFIIDYIADTLIAEGFNSGYLTSVDGYARLLGKTEENDSLSMNLRHLNSDGKVVSYNILEYNLAFSIVYFSSYPLNETDSYTDKYYKWSDGKITTPYIDIKDGMCKSSLPELICLSEKFGCAETALSVCGLFISDNFDEAALTELENEGITSIRWEDEFDGFVSTDKDLIR